MNSKNNQPLLILAGVVILLIIFALVVFWQQTPQQATVSQQQASQDTSNSNQQANANIPTLSLPPLGNTAQEATKQFYLYYFSSPTNPFANGGYKSSPYLSSSFKEVVGSLYHNGNVSVFCPQGKATNIVVGQEQSVYYNNGYLTQEVISQASGKDLYRVLLENDNGKWTIFDISCIQ